MAKATKTKTRKPKKVVVKEEELVEEVVEVKVEPEVKVESTETPTRKRRGVLTPDELLVEFDDLVTYIETECQNQKDKGNTKGTKFLRSVNKRIKNLKGKSTRTLRQRRKGTRKSSNTVSGFMKPVQVSKEMAKFAGWDHKDLKSRIDVTRYLCGYIKDNKLQRESDKRRIIPNPKLRKLLKLTKDDEDLTYYQLQQKIQCHFEKKAAAAVPTAK